MKIKINLPNRINVFFQAVQLSHYLNSSVLETYNSMLECIDKLASARYRLSKEKLFYMLIMTENKGVLKILIKVEEDKK